MDGFKKIVKMKTGGLVKAPVTGDKKAAAPSKAAEKPAFKGSDVAKEKSKPAGTKDFGIKSKESGKTPDAPSAAVKGRKAKATGTVSKFKCGGGVKKYEDGGSVLGNIATRLRNNVMGTPAQNAAAQARMDARKKAEALAAMQGASAQGIGQAGANAGLAQQLPTAPQAGPGSMSDADRAFVQGQKRGGKVKKAC